MHSALSRRLVAYAGLLALAWCRVVAADDLRIAEAVLTPIDRWEIPARSSGVLQTLQVAEGDVVRTDQILATIDDADARLAVERAQLALEIARTEARNGLREAAAAKTAAVAKAELQRAVDSVEKYKKSVSETELDRLRLGVEQTALEHQQAQHERALAQWNVRLRENELAAAQQALDRRQVRAPADGVVVELLRRRGEWVEPATTLARLTRTDRLRVEAFVDAAQARRLVGAEVVFLPKPANGAASSADSAASSANGAASSAEDAPARGRLTFVSPEVNPVNGQVRIWAEIDNADGRLRQGLSGTLVVVHGAARSAPASSPASAPRKGR